MATSTEVAIELELFLNIDQANGCAVIHRADHPFEPAFRVDGLWRHATLMVGIIAANSPDGISIDRCCEEHWSWVDFFIRNDLETTSYKIMTMTKVPID